MRRLTMRRRLAVVLTALATTVLTAAGSTAAAPAPTEHTPPLVRTESGWIRGESTAEGRQFLGIPYAQPPVGELRWRAPRPVGPGPAYAPPTTSATAVCRRRVGTPATSSPATPRTASTSMCTSPQAAPSAPVTRPVMVWLHGGGLTAGAGEDIVPDTFARQTGTVVVTVNYRLGAMGFLATSGLDARGARRASPATSGCSTSRRRLRWIRSNIGRFGGDPGRVTIAGESAGGRSVCTQMASPTSRGLFHRGIVQSGAYADCAARTHKEAVAQGADFMKKLGCESLACVRGKPAKEVLAAQAGFNWGPVAGGDFLPEQPFEAYAKGAAARVPVLNGANQDEGRMFAFAQFDNNGTPLTAEQYPEVVRGVFGEEQGERVLQRYPLAEYPSPSIAYGTAYGDFLMACPALRLNDVLAPRGPVYAYEFADRTSPPFASLRNLNKDFDFGATHVNEVQYLFKHFGLKSPLNAEQRALSRQMIQYWGSFIRNGVPHAAGQPPMPDGQEKLLSLRTASHGGNSPSTTVHREHQCDVWDRDRS